MVRPLRASGSWLVSPWKRAPQTPPFILTGAHPGRGAGVGSLARDRAGKQIKQSPVLLSLQRPIQTLQELRVWEIEILLDDRAEQDQSTGAELSLAGRLDGLQAGLLVTELRLRLRLASCWRTRRTFS